MQKRVSMEGNHDNPVSDNHPGLELQGAWRAKGLRTGWERGELTKPSKHQPPQPYPMKKQYEYYGGPERSDRQAAAPVHKLMVITSAKRVWSYIPPPSGQNQTWNPRTYSQSPVFWPITKQILKARKNLSRPKAS